MKLGENQVIRGLRDRVAMPVMWRARHPRGAGLLSESYP
jgi:hypothetical protein